MRVWLVTVGEPLPIGDASDRPWRTGLLAETLVLRGHEVLWWTSTIDHIRKKIFVAEEQRVRSRTGASIQFLSGRLYRRNVSVSRLINHVQIGKRFRELAHRETRPDIIVCSFPTVELSRECVRYGRATGVPVVLDVRDLWPDIFLDVLLPAARPFGRVALSGMFKDAAWALSSCDALFAVSHGYLAWGLQRAGRMRCPQDAVFPLGYPRMTWSQADERALNERLAACGVTPSAPFATFVGTFGRTYDLRTVIDAARIMAQHGGDRLQFVLCGIGDQETAWRAAATGIPGVAFPGWLPAGELACLLSRSDLGLAAYAAQAPQGIPNKVIEYLSAGVPVFCSLSGETRTLLESNRCGVSYPAADSQALAVALEDFLSDPARRTSMAAAARNLFEQRFAAGAVYTAMAAHVESIVERGAQVSPASAPIMDV